MKNRVSHRALAGSVGRRHLILQGSNCLTERKTSSANDNSSFTKPLVCECAACCRCGTSGRRVTLIYQRPSPTSISPSLHLTDLHLATSPTSPDLRLTTTTSHLHRRHLLQPAPHRPYLTSLHLTGLHTSLAQLPPHPAPTHNSYSQLFLRPRLASTLSLASRHPPPPPFPPPSPPPGITPKVKKVKSVYQSGECCQWYKTCQPKNIKYSCYASDLTHCESIGKDAWGAKCKACSMCVREDSLSALKVNMLITTSAGDPTSNYPREACIPASGSQVWSRKLLASSVVTEQEAEVEADWPFVKAKRGALTYRVCSNVHFSCIKYMNTAGQCAAFTGASMTNFDKIAKRWCFWCKQDPGGVAFR
ncbi:hypothetical protein CYMTET_46769 [Cymbomonas tetramitiformis]|uniref:Uncharacterized protein n=1 Tax=Cymbomonas tetramitiformis TaxID=36881 RepID=A0AAE0EXB1_9CHLO|nr:hypothetical protein CYMTET_46769 [Cymbomonas tetramitiformis]